MAEAFTVLARLLPPLLLIVGALLALRRWSGQASQPDQALRVVARTGLTRSAVVAIVAVGGRRFLLGASDAGVRLLRELEPADDPVEQISGKDPVAPQPRSGIVDRLRERTLRVTGEGSGHALRR